MSQRHRGSSERPSTPADVSAGAVRARPPSSVRVIPRDRVEAALAAAGQSAEESNEAERATTVRPQHFEEVVGVVDPLRARRPVILELDDLADKKERRRAIDLLAGVAYGLDTTVSAIATNKHALLLEPHDAAVGHLRECSVPTPDEAREPGERARRHRPDATLCVLCDMRPAEDQFASPLDTVITRDGSRIWSPPAPVCVRCRNTTRHWRFVLAWCPECERWGRRGVTSACGAPYGQ